MNERRGQPGDSTSLLQVLGELARLDVNLLVKDMSAEEAVAALRVLAEEVETILDRADRWRRGVRTRLAALERELAARWPGARASQTLQQLSKARQGLAQVDHMLQPAQALYEEVVRRACSWDEAMPEARDAVTTEDAEATEKESEITKKWTG